MKLFGRDDKTPPDLNLAVEKSFYKGGKNVKISVSGVLRIFCCHKDLYAKGKIMIKISNQIKIKIAHRLVKQWISDFLRCTQTDSK